MKLSASLSLLCAAVLVCSCSRKPAPSVTSTQPEATPGPSAAPASAPGADAAPAQPGGEPGQGGRRQGGGPGGGGGPRMSPEQRTEQLKTSLGLSDEQAQAVSALYAAQQPAMMALRDDQSLSREQRREKMQAIRASLNSQVEAILTPEQKVKREEQRKLMRDRGGNRGPQS